MTGFKSERFVLCYGIQLGLMQAYYFNAFIMFLTLGWIIKGHYLIDGGLGVGGDRFREGGLPISEKKNSSESKLSCFTGHDKQICVNCRIK